MNILTWKSLKKNPAPAPSRGNDFARLIVDNLPYIEKQCRWAVCRSPDGLSSGTFSGRHSGIDGAFVDNEIDELVNEVLDRLKANDFQVLREFKWKAKLTTYLTTIIANLVVDLVRKKKGRSRVKDRAKEMGLVGERLYDAIYRRGYSLDEAHEYLRVTWQIPDGITELGSMLDRMRGRENFHSADVSSWPYLGREVVTDSGCEVIIEDPTFSAEEIIVDNERERTSRDVIDTVLNEISAEERLILALRFPPEEGETPKSNREVADLLGLTEKAVDNRLRRILTRCRQMILQRGFSVDDLINTGN